MKEDICVILPCAGLGTRLGLKQPKELFEIWDDVPLIRFSLEHIKYAANNGNDNITIVVVISKGKEQVVEYVKSFFNQKLKVEVEYADPLVGEWPQSIFKAHTHFKAYNIVLLPDSCLFHSKKNWLINASGAGVVDCCLQSLQSSKFVAGAIPCSDERTLSNLGALLLDSESRIMGFQDKPVSAGFYNAFWGCMAFNGSVDEELFSLLSKSVRKEQYIYSDYSFYPGQAFHVDRYIDLGSWEQIEQFQLSFDSTDEFGF